MARRTAFRYGIVRRGTRGGPEPLDCTMPVGFDPALPDPLRSVFDQWRTAALAAQSLCVRSLGGRRRSMRLRTPASTRWSASRARTRRSTASPWAHLREGTLQLAELPVVTKRALMEAFDAWSTDPAVTRADVAGFLAQTHPHRRALPRPLCRVDEFRQHRRAGNLRAGRCRAGRLRRAGHGPVRQPGIRRLQLAGRRRAKWPRRADRRRHRPLRQHRVVAAAGQRQTLARHEELRGHPTRSRHRARTQCLPARIRVELSDGAFAAGRGAGRQDGWRFVRRHCGPAARDFRRPRGAKSSAFSARRCRTSTARRSASPSHTGAGRAGCTSTPTG